MKIWRSKARPLRPCGTLWLMLLLASSLGVGLLLGLWLGAVLLPLGWLLVVVGGGLACVNGLAQRRRYPTGETVPEPTLADPTPTRVEVLESQSLYDSFFRLDQATLRFERFDGSLSDPITRLVFERGDGVAVLPYDRQRREVILVQQFRYPAWVRNARDGWLWETIAGMQEQGHSPEETARREALEEAGYVLGALDHVATVYVSPGGASERLFIYVGAVTCDSRSGQGGGLASEQEDIRVRAMPLDCALAMIDSGEIVDAKTVIALQHLALHQRHLFEGADD